MIRLDGHVDVSDFSIEISNTLSDGIVCWKKKKKKKKNRRICGYFVVYLAMYM